MTAYTTLTTNSYVAAYQAEVRDGIRSAPVGESPLRGVYQRVAAWLVETRTSSTSTHRSRVASAQVRGFDRSNATGSGEISNGLGV